MFIFQFLMQKSRRTSDGERMKVEVDLEEKSERVQARDGRRVGGLNVPK